MEVMCLKEFFIKRVLDPKSKADPDHENDFFKLKMYECEFSTKVNQQFKLQSPTIIKLFRDKLLYGRELK